MLIFKLLLSSTLLLLSYLAYSLQRKLNYWKLRGIAHEKPHLIMGNLQGLRSKRAMYEIIHELYNKFKGTGPFCGMHYFGQPAVLVLDLQLAKNILTKDFANFADRGLYNNIKHDPFTGNMFMLSGEKWRQLRQKLSPTFTASKMRGMYSTILQVTEQLVAVLNEQRQKHSEVVDIKELVNRFTADVIGHYGFGIECNSLRNPQAEFRQVSLRNFDQPRHNTVVEGLIESYPRLARMLGMKTVRDDITEFFTRIVKETVSMRQQQNIKGKDFMQTLIELNNAEHSAGLSINEMATQAFTFFVASFEPSSNVMSFALYELARQPAIQNKLRAEIEQSWRKHKQQLSYECIMDIAYLDQVIFETMRLHKTGGQLHRKASADYAVQGADAKFFIEKGTKVIIPTTSFYQDAELYENPSEFNPERFTPENQQQREAAAFMPFGDGPRNCLGMRFALMQTRLVLSYLLMNFHFEICEQTEKMQYNFSSGLLRIKGAVNLRVTKL